MRMIIPALALIGLAAAGGCATEKTFQTVLNVCSSGNGTVKSATVVKSSGDASIDQNALEVGKAMVYEPTREMSCRPLTVDHKVTGEAA